MTNFQELLRLLTESGVEFVVISGLAVISHGHARATLDLDICYARSPENVTRLAAALAPVRPNLRGAPANLPFIWDTQTLRNGLNFTLTTSAGDIDVLGEVTGLGGYGEIALRGPARARRAARLVSMKGYDETRASGSAD